MEMMAFASRLRRAYLFVEEDDDVDAQVNFAADLALSAPKSCHDNGVVYCSCASVTGTAFNIPKQGSQRPFGC